MLQAMNEWLANEWLDEELITGGRFSLYTSRALPTILGFDRRDDTGCAKPLCRVSCRRYPWQTRR